MEPSKGLMYSLISFWQSATTSQKMALVAFVMAGIAAVGVIVSVATRPSYAPLYSGLQQDDAGKIVEKLREQKVPYRLTGGGSAVEVASDKVHEVRLQLAEEGLPRGGNVGFELFDTNRVGLTQFGERINYQRALQGELARTISEIDSVSSARVHLVVPEPKLYEEEEARPSASVVLRMRGGRVLAQRQIRGIVHLASSAVEGLSPDDVKILDTSGNLLSAPSDISYGSGGGGIVLARLEMAREFERRTEQKVQSMLDEVAGPNKAVVRINATLDFDSIEMEEAIYEPAGEGKGVLESQQELRESYKGKGVPPASGVPGVTSNLIARPTPSTATGENEGYERVETSSKYQITKKIQKSSVGPGQVKKIQMALFVDQSIESAQLAALEKAASAAAGIDPQRGDQVVVESIPFAQPEEGADEGGGASRAREFYFSVGKDVLAALLLVVFLVFVRSLFKAKGEAAPVVRPARKTTAARSSTASASAPRAPALARETVRVPGGNGETTTTDLDSEKMAYAIQGLLGESEEG
ncbi:MAG: flagellar M-ring protein FliF [Armatimonadetes bacterium]|nr:flagellar M-ring protein FliF [Armatimonadota bacterium]NIM24379.1 flagellar M-ring protein FliF [Armatimonadota bacterium]NIM68248.1 flagellar M-ring protein FliF [Armatimonadota bacterium]NIM75149.1 flagellar M-ring protein FliF [Armatimonadota bacterium]NIN06453.1 flagellar M-ring protein FliF [Armatimonadota bacterium]